MDDALTFTFPAFLLSAALIILCTAGSSMGAGFALTEQSASGLGNAFAGGSAVAEDATTVFFNPAGLTRLEGQEIIGAAHVIMPSANFNNQGSTHVLQGETNIPLLGGNGGDGGVTKVIPNFYYSIKVNDRLALGLGIESPFGLATNYDSGWVGRYHALESDLTSVNFNPSVAYKITSQLSAGAGINVQYIKAKLSNAIDFGTLDVLGALGLPPGALHLIPQMSDGYVRLEGDSWGLGYNLGLLYEFTKDTRMGVAYRSRIQQNLKGDADFENVPAGLNPLPVFKNSGIQAKLTLPDSFSVSVVHSFSPEWMVMADFTWTNWSLFKELQVKFDNPYQPDAVTSEQWQDSYRYSLGLTYRPSSNWTLRTGVAYDTSAVSTEQYRTPRIPDSYRFWTALGLGYKISQAVSFDLGYAHIFVSDSSISMTPTGENALLGGLQGTYNSHINILSAQVNIKF